MGKAITKNLVKLVRTAGKMGKRYKNGLPPEEVGDEFGVDTLRLYEMGRAFRGPGVWKESEACSAFSSAFGGILLILTETLRSLVRQIQIK